MHVVSHLRISLSAVLSGDRSSRAEAASDNERKAGPNPPSPPLASSASLIVLFRVVDHQGAQRAATQGAAAGFVNFVIATGFVIELVLEIAMAVARAAVRPLHTADGAGAASVLAPQPINKQMVRYI